MFRLSLISDEVSQSPEEAARFARANGIGALELRSVNGHGPFEWTGEDIAQVDRLLERTELGISALALPFFKCAMEDEEQIAAHLEGLRTAMTLAKRWGVGIVRGFTFWKESGSWERAVALYRTVAPRVEDAGLIMALETEPSVHTGNAGQLAAFLEAVDSPALQALWDPGNLPFDPCGERPFPEGYALLRGRVAHVHLKDAVGCGDTARAVCLGTGLVDFPGQLRALREDGYSGYLSLETHYRLAAELTEEQLRRPGGAAFSDGGWEASQQCMDALKQWI